MKKIFALNISPLLDLQVNIDTHSNRRRAV